MAVVLRISNGQGRLSPFWYAAYSYRDKDGRLKRVKKTTGTTDRKEAQLIANDLELRTADIAKGRLTATRMKESLTELFHRITGEKIVEYTAESWLRLWLEQKATTTKPGTLKRYRGVVDNFLKSLGRKASGGLEHVLDSDVLAFRQKETGSGKSADSCNLDVKTVSMAFRKAWKLGHIPKNPCDGVEKLDADGERRQPFTLEQVKQILTHAPDDEWRGLILVGLYTGARLGDCSRMTWGNVDLHESILRFKPAKTTRGKKGKEVLIPMHPALHAHLMKLDSSDDPKAFVFPTLAGYKLGGIRGLSRRFQEIMVNAGVLSPVARERGKATDGSKRSAGRAVASLTFHSLRHTLTSILHNAGVSQELRMQVTGHSTVESHRGYTHSEISTLRDALEKVPSV
jgi:integrase